MTVQYLIDSENVGDFWIPLLELPAEKTELIVFYTRNSPHMSYDSLIRLKESDRKVTFIRCYEGTNALDFQLVSDLGYRIGKDEDGRFVIVTNDTGFDAAVKYWRRNKKSVKRITGKECKNLERRFREDLSEAPGHRHDQVPVRDHADMDPETGEALETAAVEAAPAQDDQDPRTSRPSLRDAEAAAMPDPEEEDYAEADPAEEERDQAEEGDLYDDPETEEEDSLEDPEDWSDDGPESYDPGEEEASGADQAPVPGQGDDGEQEETDGGLKEREENEFSQIEFSLKELSQTEPALEAEQVSGESEAAGSAQEASAESPDHEAAEEPEEADSQAAPLETAVDLSGESEAAEPAVPEQEEEASEQAAEAAEPAAALQEKTAEAPEAETVNEADGGEPDQEAGDKHRSKSRRSRSRRTRSGSKKAETAADSAESPARDTADPQAEEVSEKKGPEPAREKTGSLQVEEVPGDEEIARIVACIGADNLAELHNQLATFYGDQGKEIYLSIKNNTRSLPVLKPDLAQKFSYYCEIIFARSDYSGEYPSDISEYLLNVREKLNNLNSLRYALQKHYGKEKGRRFYFLLKPFAKTMYQM